MTKPHSIAAMARQASALTGQQDAAQNHRAVAAVTHHWLFINYVPSQGAKAHFFSPAFSFSPCLLLGPM